MSTIAKTTTVLNSRRGGKRCIVLWNDAICMLNRGTSLGKLKWLVIGKRSLCRSRKGRGMVLTV